MPSLISMYISYDACYRMRCALFSFTDFRFLYRISPASGSPAAPDARQPSLKADAGPQPLLESLTPSHFIYARLPSMPARRLAVAFRCRPCRARAMPPARIVSTYYDIRFRASCTQQRAGAYYYSPRDGYDIGLKQLSSPRVRFLSSISIFAKDGYITCHDAIDRD